MDATWTDPDSEILSCLNLNPATHRIERTESARYTVIAADEARTEGIAGLALIFEGADGDEWFLACPGCEVELEQGEAGMCTPCRSILAAQDAGMAS